jgi:hypothetical protein
MVIVRLEVALCDHFQWRSFASVEYSIRITPMRYRETLFVSPRKKTIINIFHNKDLYRMILVIWIVLLLYYIGSDLMIYLGIIIIFLIIDIIYS